MNRIITLSLITVMFALSSAIVTAQDVQPEQDPTREALDSRLPEIDVDNVALVDAIDFLRDVSGANIHVNWTALEQWGVTQDTPVNMRLRGVTLRRVLDLMLSDAGGDAEVTFYLDENIIRITTRQLAEQQLFTRIYMVEDLLLETPEFEGPEGAMSGGMRGSANGRGTGGGIGLGSTGGTRGAGYTGTQRGRDGRTGRTGAEDFTTKEERAEGLVEVIQDTIQPDIWQENGGPASIRYYDGHLIVTAPFLVHEAIGGSRGG